MGGSAFASGPDPLSTPRMPPEVYHAVKSRCHSRLCEIYTCVASPIDGPAKKDFGDVDILVTWPRDPGSHAALLAELPRGAALVKQVGEAIGAERVVVDMGGGVISAHFAVPWPESASRSACPADPAGEDGVKKKKKHIQVDVRVCESLENMEWMLFKHAHGDIWNLLGTIIRPFGLSVDDSALWLRIPDIELFDKKRAKVFLTAEPAEVLRFLGLPVADFWDRPFDAQDDLFEYAARCRMFWIGSGDESANDGGGLTSDRMKLKANDRKRMARRPGFRLWIDEFIPRCRAEGRFLARPTSRRAVTAEAFARFRAAEREFHARRREFLQERNRLYVKNTVIKGEVPMPDDPADMRGVVLAGRLRKALARVLLARDGSYNVPPPAEEEVMVMDGKGGLLFDEDKLRAWIGRCREELGRETTREAERMRGVNAEGEIVGEDKVDGGGGNGL